MNGPESRCSLSRCSGMELHHPIMSKLWDIGGRNKRKERYKIEGDGFRCDALCDIRFTYQVYFCNHPAPPKYIKMNLSPLYSCIMALSDALQEKNHVYGMDNLYNLAKFCRKA